MNEKNRRPFENEYIEGLLSCIIVTYNSGDYLFEAIDSILKQNYPSIELIISDDGTKDFEEDEIRSYIDARQKKNLKNVIIIYREKNIGTVRNINYALRITNGEYIKILGGDDTYPNIDTFYQQVNSIKQNKALVSIGKCQQCNSVMEPISDDRVEKSNACLPLVLNMNYLEARKYISKHDIFPIAIQAVCYHRNFFMKKGLCDEDYIVIDDAPSAIRILEEAKNVVYINLFTVNHRAKVGISSSRELFAARRLSYYKDCVTYAEKEIFNRPDIYGAIYRKESLRINKFVYEIAKAKKEGKGLGTLFAIALVYLDAIFYYVFWHPKKFAKRIVDRFFV